ncbi:MAG: DUF4139 domain-containing protein [Planctomycetes bacterium]|nr:DUF4139 domain-containing protein [Planctomycetota bacterium]
MRPIARLVVLPLALVSCALARAQAPDAAKPALPVREVTVFKDGHAYLLREQPLASGTDGRVVLDELPVPVLGTFWPFATDGARLVHAKAGREEVASEVDALDLRQLIEANVGKRARLRDAHGDDQTGILRGVPKREQHGGGATFVLLEGEHGVRAVPLEGLRWIEVEGELARKVTERRSRERLELRVDGGGADAKVGVVYVQQGLRWIPSYKLDIDGAGAARVQLEAALQNDLIDLVDATVHLVVGVPTFEFKDLVDPISLQAELARVAAQMELGQNFSNRLSNSLMTQTAGFLPPESADSDASEVAGGEAAEDLFVFTIKRITLRKGERMVLPLREFTLSYKDVYTLDVPLSPPMELRSQLQNERVMELARALASPKALHVLRLKNDSDVPLTTAPALVLSKGRILAQGRMHYASVGAETDLTINPAIDVFVKVDESEVERISDAERWNKESYGRIELAGSVELRNGKSVPIELEVRRRVLGMADTIGQGGERRQLDLVALWGESRATSWWSWWNWPYWWFHFNGFGEFRWNVKLSGGAATRLECGWHYFWR